MDVNSEMPRLRGCGEAFLWISQHLNGFTYNLQKCSLSLWKLRAGVSPSYTSPPGQHEEPNCFLIIRIIAMPSIVLGN